MAARVANLWLRICGIFASVFGAFFSSSGSSFAAPDVSFTPQQISNCQWTSGIKNGHVVYHGDPVGRYDGRDTTNAYNGVPWFCWDAWALENKEQLCEDAYGTPGAWVCEPQKEHSYGFIYQKCVRESGVSDCRLIKNGQPIYNAVADYGTMTETIFRIVGCINPSHIMTGASAGDTVSEAGLNQVECNSLAVCPSPGYGVDAIMHDPSYNDVNNCYFWGATDSGGRFIYYDNGDSCACFYDGRVMCS